MQLPTYKRTSSRDYSETMDVDDNSGFLQNDTWQDNRNPSWKRSLPHVLVATLSSFLFGYHLGVVNEPLESISSDLGFKGNTLQEGLVVSICLGGAFVGSVFSGWVADGFGRRRAFQLCAIPMILGACVSALATSLQGMLLGRLLVGVGMGLGPPVASLYVTEISPAFIRGTYGSFIQIATCLGLMGALVVGIPSKDITEWWRMCFWLSIIPAVTLAFGMMLCAESPEWLYKQGRSTDAEAEFERLLGGSHVNSAMMELEKSDRGDAEGIKLLELISGRHSRVVFIGSTLFALQQLSGINAVFYFSSTVFRSAGIPSNLANVFVGISNLAGSIIAMSLMDKVGRKLLLLWSFLGMALSMALQVAGASSYMPKGLAFYLSVGGMLLFVLTFATGAGPVPGLLLPEIFPSRIRAKAMAFCMSVHWVINFFVGLLFLRLLEKLGPQFLYTIFSTVCLIAVAFVKKNVIETKGRSLQEIEIALLPDDLVNLRKKWVHNQMPWLMLPDGNTDVDEDGYSKTDFVLPRVLNEIEDDLEFMSEARSGGEELYTRGVLNLRSRKSYNIKCPELYGRSCWGSAFGWIVTAGGDGKMFMFNPLTKTRVSLPSFATSRRQLPNVFEWENEDEWGDKIRCNFFVKRAVVLNVGADDAQSYGDGVEHLRVVVFYSDHHNVAIVKPGDRRWVEIVAESEVHAPVMDVLYDKEMGLIFVDRKNGLARCNIPENHEPPLLKWIKHPKPVGPIYQNDGDYEGLYILKVGADIFMLKRIVCFEKSNDERLRTKRLANRHMNIYSYTTLQFDVYKLGHDKNWIYIWDMDMDEDEIDELKKIAIFVGNNATMWVNARRAGCLGNHIYFTDDTRRDFWVFKGLLGGNDNGISCSNGQELNRTLYEGSNEPSSYSFPIFFRPSISPRNELN